MRASHHRAPRPAPARRRHGRARWGDASGTGMVEAALAVPIFLVFVLGFVDLGLGVFQSSQATSAAADGARTAMVRFAEADVPGSADHDAVEASIRARLVGQRVDSITIECVRPGGATVTCDDADPEVDRVRVSVSWEYEPLSPIGTLVPTQTLTGSATVGLVDQPVAAPGSTTTTAPTTTTTSPASTTTTTAPTTTTTPSTCAVVSATATPATVSRKSNGQLQDGFAISVITNGAANCTSLRVVLPTGTTTAYRTLTQQSSTSWTATVSKNAYTWTTGPKAAQVQRGTTTIATQPLVTVN